MPRQEQPAPPRRKSMCSLSAAGRPVWPWRRKSPARLEPYYARRLLDLATDEAACGDNADPHQVTARLERLDPAHEGQTETVKARYLVGCDGARSTVRKSIGRALHGDSANHA